MVGGGHNRVSFLMSGLVLPISQNNTRAGVS